jgi:lycopene beta-cyclase
MKPKLSVPWLFLSAWVLTMVSMPIVRWTLGDSALRVGISAGVVMQILAVMIFLWQAWGAQRTLMVGTGTACLGWAAEWLGSTTGFPFGSYDYTPALQPQLGGVPLLIPLAWLMMLPPAWAVAGSWLHNRELPEKARRPVFVVLSALAFTAWDLFLDPQMVGWGFWVWEQPGAYFGIPLVNFGGWLLVSGLITALLGREDVPMTPMLIVYAVTWGLQTIGQLFFWDQAGPALVGFIGMGVMLLPQLSRLQAAARAAGRQVAR